MERETARLKTEFVDGRVHALGCCVFKETPDTGQVEDLEHDALYAHALVQAIKEYRAPWVLTQADAIMAYWQKGAK
ncbi:MAG: hypothetical protein ACYDBH_01400 [Acidobacteriaceae bacterium]